MKPILGSVLVITPCLWENGVTERFGTQHFRVQTSSSSRVVEGYEWWLGVSLTSRPLLPSLCQDETTSLFGPHSQNQALCQPLLAP